MNLLVMSSIFEREEFAMTAVLIFKDSHCVLIL